MYDVIIAAAVTPSPTPSAPPADLVTPGPWGFVVIAFLALVVFLLVWDMLRRIRRGRYREDIAAELDAEEQARAATRASNVDDQDIDPDDDPARR
jgi:flagellar biosynthesis/type III secretory pathway M-ring protein FliF/YscJ